MKKAVIQSGNKQYLVSEGDQIEVEKLNTDKKTTVFAALLVIDNDKYSIGKPEVEKSTVTADVINPEIKTEKVQSIRFKSKKRVRKIRGHRQIKTVIKIKKIA